MRNLKKWRKMAGISQEKLAELCQSAHSYIRQIECGNRLPSFSLIEKLANALNIEPYLLLYDEKTDKADLVKIQLYKAEDILFEDIKKSINKILNEVKLA